MLITSYGKEMLLFNFNSTREEFSQYESELRKSLCNPPIFHSSYS